MTPLNNRNHKQRPTHEINNKARSDASGSDVESVSYDIEDSSKDYSMNGKGKKQRKISIHKWDNVVKQLVERLQQGMNSLKACKIKGFSPGNNKVFQDGRRWTKPAPGVGKAMPAHALRTVRDLRNVQSNTALSRSSLEIRTQLSLKKARQK